MAIFPMVALLKKNLRNSITLIIIIFLSLPFTSHAQEQFLGDTGDGNRSVPVHLIKLYDEHGSVIRPDENPLLPFSTRETCGKCHDYEKIRGGWHFNEVDSTVAPGRPGEPWILVDPVTATQIPISQRGWPGTFRPDQLGMAPMQFIEKFGSHLPGGGVGDDEEAILPENFLRWQVSGKLEINCLSCHDAEPAHDQAKFAAQISKQNFRWAAAASSGFASVAGSAKNMPDNYGIYSSVPPAVSDKIPPSVTYGDSRFNHRNEVFFDIVRKIPAERCYFCHSTKTIDHERWQENEDVHLQAGMSCTGCHRNGLDHKMVRGYEGEPQVEENPAVTSFSCEGCHLGNDNLAATAGRFGAPRPQHNGMPPVHFEKMACTACHAGAWPENKTAAMKTSRAHKLGTFVARKDSAALPHIIAPVIMKQPDGKIAPHKLLWPSFWAELQGDSIQPMMPQQVRPFMLEIFLDDTLRAPGNWARLTNEQVTTVLDTLAKQDSTQKAFAYITAGKLYRLDENGQLANNEHPAASPYSWPLAHDVRPAVQSLGAHGCGDCHATDSPFYFGEVAMSTPLVSAQNSNKRMNGFQNTSAFYQKIFALSFVFRPWLKALMLFASLIIFAVLAIYVFQGLASLLKIVARE